MRPEVVFAHTGHSETFERLANRMGAPLGTAAVVATAKQLASYDWTGVRWLVAVWWRAAEPLVESLPNHVKLCLCIYDHKSWRTHTFGPPAKRCSLVTAANPRLADELREIGFSPIDLQDGVDCDVFLPGNHVPGSGQIFRIGWAGSSASSIKRLDVLESARPRLLSHGIDLVVQDSNKTPIPHEGMPEWYQHLDALICVSEREGTPNPILEACASGLPYVSTPVGLVPAIHAETQGGIPLQANPSMMDIVNACMDLKRADIVAMGRRNREHVQACRRWDFSALYDALGVAKEKPLSSVAVGRSVGCPCMRSESSRHPRILVVNRTLGLGGGERSAVLVANALIGLYRVDIALTMSDVGALRPPELDGRVGVFMAPTPEDLLQILDAGYAAVIANNAVLPWLEVCEKGVAKIVCIARGFVRWSLLQLPGAPVPEQTQIWAITEEVKQGLLERRPDLSGEQIDVVPNGIDTRRFHPDGPKADLPWSGDIGPVFGFIGRFAPVKNIPLLVRLFAAAKTRAPAAKLVIVAGCDKTAAEEYQRGWRECEENVMEEIERNGLTADVHLTGMVDDPERWYRAIDTQLLASTYEGMPLTVLEAMASGVPVVTTAVGNVQTLLGHGGGIVVEGNPVTSADVRSAYVDAMLQAAEHRDEIGKAGRLSIVSHFSADLHQDAARGFLGKHVPRRRINVAALYDEQESPFWLVSNEIRLAMPDADVEMVSFADVRLKKYQFECDAVFVPSYYPAVALAEQLPEAVGLVTTVPNHYRWRGGLSRTNLETALKRSSAMLCTNDRLLGELAYCYPMYAGKLKLAWSGVDADVFSPASKIDEEPFVVGWAGRSARHGELKGVDLIREACEGLRGASLVLADGDEIYRSRNEMAKWYRGLDAYVCMSSSEGTCNPLLEAASCGIPSISTDVGVASELARSGACRLVGRTVEALQVAIAEMADDREQAKAMGERGRMAVLTEWQWRRRIRIYVDAIEEAIA